MTAPTRLVLSSTNRKTGQMAVTYRSRGVTCPTACPFFGPGNGCYAAGRLDAKASVPTPDWVDQAIAGIPRKGMLRLDVVGDLLDGGEVDHGYLADIRRLAMARPDVAIYTYTHVDPDVIAEWLRVMPPNVVINASTETPTGARRAIEAGMPATMVLTGADDPVVGAKVAGRRVIVCPEQTNGVTCAQCGLCARADTEDWRRPVIGFIPHGAAKKTVSATVAALR